MAGIAYIEILLAILLITITLEFFVFREIGNIYTMLEKIQKKDLSEIFDKKSKSSKTNLITPLSI